MPRLLQRVLPHIQYLQRSFCNNADKFRSTISRQSTDINSERKTFNRVITHCIGTTLFILLGLNEISKPLSNFINNNICKDYNKCKEMYKNHINGDLTTWPKADAIKRIEAEHLDILIISIVLSLIRFRKTSHSTHPTSFIAAMNRSTYFVGNILVILLMCRMFNHQSPGYFLMDLRAIYVDKTDKINDDNLYLYRAQMDYINMLRMKMAWCPFAFGIYMFVPVLPTTIFIILFYSHIVQVFTNTNRTWFDKWARVQVIDMNQLYDQKADHNA